MAWTTPKTWSSEPLTSTDMNTYIRDNQNYLKDRMDNQAQHSADESSDYSSSSTTWVDVDATEGKFQHTITTHGGNVLVGFCGYVKNNGGAHGRYPYFDIAVDGVQFAGDDGLASTDDTGGMLNTVSFVVLVTGLTADEHVFKLQWKQSNANANDLYAGAGTSAKDLHPQFWVQEI